jgi:hypothetical protein
MDIGRVRGQLALPHLPGQPVYPIPGQRPRVHINPTNVRSMFIEASRNLWLYRARPKPARQRIGIDE